MDRKLWGGSRLCSLQALGGFHRNKICFMSIPTLGRGGCRGKVYRDTSEILWVKEVEMKIR